MSEKIEIYTLKELEEKHPDGYKKALENMQQKVRGWDIPYLADDLTAYIKREIDNYDADTWRELEAKDIDVNYSLSYSQNEGLSFTGRFTVKLKEVTLLFLLKRTSTRSPYKNTVKAQYDGVWDFSDDLEREDIENMDIDSKAEKVRTHLKQMHDEIAEKTKEYGYEVIEYQESEENIRSLAEINDWKFTEKGQKVHQ